MHRVKIVSSTNCVGTTIYSNAKKKKKLHKDLKSLTKIDSK